MSTAVSHCAPASGFADLALKLTIPCDARLIETVRALGTRVAAHVGYTTDQAESIGAAVSRAVTAVIERDVGGDTGRPIEIRFSTSAGEMEIQIRHTAANGLPLEDLRRTMPSIDVKQETGMSICRLRRPLP